MEKPSSLNIIIESIPQNVPKSIGQYIEEQIELSKKIQKQMGIPFWLEQSDLPEIIIDKNGVAKELQTIDRKNHFTDSMYAFPEAIIARDQWLSLYDLEFGLKQIKKR